MSIKIMTAVFEHSEARGNDRLVLLALADWANDEFWTAWPSISNLARKARVSDRTAQRCLQGLVDGEHLALVGQATADDMPKTNARWRPNKYRILRPWAIGEGCQPDTCQGDTCQLDGCQWVTPRGDKSRAPGVTLLSPNPLEEPSKNRDRLVVSDEARALCDLLVELMVERECKQPAVTDVWLREADRLYRLDGREPTKAERLLRWSQADTFWRGVVQSIPNFRKQYDKIRDHANRERAEQAKRDKADAERQARERGARFVQRTDEEFANILAKTDLGQTA